jgi:putative Ca2+/H+ antiporter (TMEM165/GDT1 family)
VSLIGALFGSVVSKVVPTEYFQVVAGLLFVGMGIIILIRAFGSILA